MGESVSSFRLFKYALLERFSVELGNTCYIMLCAHVRNICRLKAQMLKITKM